MNLRILKMSKSDLRTENDLLKEKVSSLEKEKDILNNKVVHQPKILKKLTQGKKSLDLILGSQCFRQIWFRLQAFNKAKVFYELFCESKNI